MDRERTGWGVDELADNPQFDFINKFIDNEQDDELFQDFNKSPYSEVKIGSRYVDFNTLTTNSSSNISIMSLNIQSLQAKFNEFNDLINFLATTNKSPDVICLQETWNVSDPDIFSLDGYHPLISRNRSFHRGGGVGIYIKSTLNYKPLNHLSLFHEKKI